MFATGSRLCKTNENTMSSTQKGDKNANHFVAAKQQVRNTKRYIKTR